ncbi:MAG: glutamate dehydrogenase, partial [Glaciecola sp.]
ARMSEAILAAWRGQLELDAMNRLVAGAKLTWRQTNVLRAYRRYRRQAGTQYTPEYVNETVAEHPDVARSLIAYFEGKFEPRSHADDVHAWETRADEVVSLRSTCHGEVDKVSRLDQDRILRGFVALIDATLRTNMWREEAVAEQVDGEMVGYLSLKLDSSLVPDLPQPVPYREIFVYSPAVEGIHLRGGPVARGGLRWSDRRDDFRTEVLGLMKAQMSKNAVIVPTGAKGGFVLKRAPEDREQLRGEVARQYVTFIRALLDVTDNIVGGEIVAPPNVVRHDPDDPYLVVAADKGTATFSDTANGVADDYGFWLGDAFASGGSKGYDHKKLGITARGGWVAVRQHFTELGVDIQSEPITVVGIGDMSGDVFGNGMLLSKAIKLVAAFDHRDIFLDPNPDPEISYLERARMFEVPRSSWQDYDTTKLSAGGGIFSRSLKSIPLSEEVRAALRIDEAELSPPALMQAILKAPADLFWAGGIGTYIKASSETHDDVGDKSSDDLRVNADQLRVRVIGEGANLSITQAGRIQYARRGGRINMDAVDNVAGVDSSDHEVNVKIFLRLAIEAGQITSDERDHLLEEVTEDVVEHVLRDVKLQAQRLSLELAQAPGSMHAYERLMTQLEERGMLHRDVEVLPDTATMRDRLELGAGLTRPELAVLVAYAKRVLTEQILESDLPDTDSLQPIMDTYFPALLVSRFGDLLCQHRLRRELISTIVANDLVNRMGVTFAFDAARSSDRTVQDVAGAYWAARQVAGSESRHAQVEALAGIIPPERSMDLSLRVNELVGNLTHAYLSESTAIDIARLVHRDGDLLHAFAEHLSALGTESQRFARADQAALLMDDLVDESLATFLAATEDLAMVPAIASVAVDRAGVPVADAFLWMDYALAISRLQALVDRAGVSGRWDREQQGGLILDLVELRTTAVRMAFAEHPGEAEATSTQRFLEARRPRITAALLPLQEIESAEHVQLDALAVLSRDLRRVVLNP